MLAGSALAQIRLLFNDTNADFITDPRGIDWLNRAQSDVCARLWPLTEIKPFSVTAKSNRFILASDCLVIEKVMWYKSQTRCLEYAEPKLWYAMEEGSPNAVGTPTLYTMIRRADGTYEIRVGPEVPGTSSATVAASGVLATTGATVSVATYTGLRSKGFLIAGTTSEVIEYTGVATGAVTGGVRAAFNTATTASMASNGTLFQADLLITYRKIANLLTGSTSTFDLPTAYQYVCEDYVLAMAYQARGDLQRSQLHMQAYEKKIEDIRKGVSRKDISGPMRIREMRGSPGVYYP